MAGRGGAGLDDPLGEWLISILGGGQTHACLCFLETRYFTWALSFLFLSSDRSVIGSLIRCSVGSEIDLIAWKTL